MKTASATKVAAQFNDYLEASQEQPVLVTRNGKPVAVLMAVRNKAQAEKLAAGPRSLRSVFQEPTSNSSRVRAYRTTNSGNRWRSPALGAREASEAGSGRLKANRLKPGLQLVHATSLRTCRTSLASTGRRSEATSERLPHSPQFKEYGRALEWGYPQGVGWRPLDLFQTHYLMNLGGVEPRSRRSSWVRFSSESIRAGLALRSHFATLESPLEYQPLGC